MAVSKTTEQVRAEHLRMLGPNLGPLYTSLNAEVAWLHLKWNQHRVLFESSEVVQLLNSVAGHFFFVIHEVLFEDIVLHIARLTDPPQSRGRDNLTLLRLSKAVPETLVTEIKNLVDQTERHAQFAKDWRNRHLAHRDLELAVDERATPLSRVTCESVGIALASMGAVLNKIEDHFWHGQVAFEHIIAGGDAEALVFYLKVALDAEKRGRELEIAKLRRP
ncbi:MAG: AbiU2 domain-containing protein [Candidatus Binataceae bacterium]